MSLGEDGATKQCTRVCVRVVTITYYRWECATDAYGVRTCVKVPYRTVTYCAKMDVVDCYWGYRVPESPPRGALRLV